VACECWIVGTLARKLRQRTNFMLKPFGYSKEIRNFWKQPKIYIISYPKTGRTWLKALIGKSLSEIYDLPENRLLDSEYISSTSGLPRTVFTHDGSAMLEKRSYKELNKNKRQYRNKKVLLLSREVKDTLVSAYFQATKRVGVFDGSISEFIRSERYGAIKILTFYKYWSDARSVPKDFLFLRYEDLHKNPEVTLEGVLRFLGAQKIDTNILRAAINYSSFNNLRKAEVENRFKASILSPTNIDDPESFKVREGKMGNYSKYLSREDIKYVDNLIDVYGCEFTIYQEDRES
jgi:hypothetical protein